MTADASNFAIGACLNQCVIVKPNNRHFSHGNYNNWNWELLAIFASVRK